MRFAVALRVEREVTGLQGLPLGHERHELVFAHRLQRVVVRSLFADRRLRLGRQLLAARGTGAMRREHPRGVGQGEQPVAQRVVELASEPVDGEAGRNEKVGSPDVADEQRVARQYAVRNVIVAVFVNDEADRLGRVSRCREHPECHVAEQQCVTVRKSFDRVVDADGLAVRDHGASSRRELEMATEEVGVHVRLDDPFDGESLRVGVADVSRDVSLRVDHDGTTRGLVAHEV